MRRLVAPRLVSCQGSALTGTDARPARTRGCPMPLSLRCYTFALVAVAVATVALLPPSSLESISLLALCALVVLAERLSRVKIGVSGSTMSISLVVTVITVLVLSPSEAALVGMVTSMFTPRTATWNWTKQFFNTGMLSVVPAIAAAVCHLTGGRSGGQVLSFPAFLWPVAAAGTTRLGAHGLIIAGYFTLAANARFLHVLRCGF